MLFTCLTLFFKIMMLSLPISCMEIHICWADWLIYILSLSLSHSLSVCLSLCVPLSLCVSLCISLSVCLYLCLSISLSLSVSVFLSLCVSLSISVSLSTLHSDHQCIMVINYESLFSDVTLIMVGELPCHIQLHQVGVDMIRGSY